VSNNKFCTNCGSVIVPGDRFCTGCGAEVNTKEFCQNCGAEVNAEQAFCTKCGFSLKAKSAEPIPAAPEPIKTAAQPAPKPQVAKPVKKSKTGLIIGIIIAVIVLATAAFIGVRYLTDDDTEDTGETDIKDSIFDKDDAPDDKPDFGKDDEDVAANTPDVDVSTPDTEEPDEDNASEEIPEEVFDDSVIASGNEPYGLDWTLDKDGILTLEGEWNGDDANIPWEEYLDEIVTVNISDGISIIGSRAFEGAAKINSVQLPSSVTDVYPNAFNNCSELTEIEFSDGLMKLWENSFASCSKLESVLLPASLSEISSGAFSDCSSLNAVYYTGTKAEWKNITISGEGNEILNNVIVHCLDADIVPLDIVMLEDEMNQLMLDIAGGAKWSMFVRKINGADALSSENTEALSASAMVIVPILYTVAAEVDAGNLSLTDAVTITMNTGGRTQLAGSVGKSITINELCRYMLLYSDNIATNTLLQHLGFERIMKLCSDKGFESVKLANYLMQTQDNTSNDNYVSVQDLCGMLSDLYSDTYISLGKQFLRDNMVIQDSTARDGLIASMSGNLTIMNLNGQKADKYNEVVIVDNGTDAFVMAFMSNGTDLASLKHAAKEVGAYIISRLGIN